MKPLLFLLATIVFAQPPVPRRAPPVQTQQSPEVDQKPCRLEGRVSNALTGEPLRKAMVTLRGGGQDRAFATYTNDGGQFVLDGVPPGRYNLSAQRNGYLNGSYGAKRPGQSGTPLQLASGQQAGELEIKLAPQGIVTGRILDEDGEPLQGVQVNLLKMETSRGRRNWQPANGSATNDTGEYRITSVAPGRYLVMANNRMVRNMVGARITFVGKGSDDVYPQMYHPNATTVASAVPIEIGPGSEMRGVDFRLRKVRGYAVRGRVEMPTPGEPARRADVLLMPENEPGTQGAAFNAPARPDGSFELRAIPPGQYSVAAYVTDGKRNLSGRTRITLGEEALENVTVRVEEPFAITGSVIAEGNPQAIDYRKVNLSVTAVENELRFLGGGMARVDNTGKFRLERMVPGKYQVNASQSNDDYYVKAVRMGSADLLGKEWEVTAPAQLEIVLAPGPASVAGTVQDEKGNPAKGAVILLVSTTGRDDLRRNITADQNGSFEVKNLAPGEYYLFPFEDADLSGLSDPATLKPYEAKATKVRLSERARESVTLKLIPPA
jgi:protocatechuate 3,4-dioxygenase beta subunit